MPLNPFLKEVNLLTEDQERANLLCHDVPWASWTADGSPENVSSKRFCVSARLNAIHRAHTTFEIALSSAETLDAGDRKASRFVGAAWWSVHERSHGRRWLGACLLPPA